MKKLTILILLIFTVLSCDKGKKQRILSNSSGRINHLLVVVDNIQWEQQVGEKIRELFASPIEGLNQEEPLFSISQMPPQVFSGFTTKNRIILEIENGKKAQTEIKHDVYAKPQTLVTVSGMNNSEIIKQLEQNSEQIIKALKNEEIKERQRQISKSLFDDSALEDSLGVSLKFSSVYRIAKATKNFFWIRRDIATGTMDLMVYEVPLSYLRQGDSLVTDIVRMRDSVGKAHIQGRFENTYMITEKAYAPYIFKTTIDNKPTIETKGLWEVNNDFMGGPFINYAIEDKKNKRYLIIEGYVFAPSVNKRDYMFELEAIIRSAKIL